MSDAKPTTVSVVDVIKGIGSIAEVAYVATSLPNPEQIRAALLEAIRRVEAYPRLVEALRLVADGDFWCDEEGFEHFEVDTKLRLIADKLLAELGEDDAR